MKRLKNYTTRSFEFVAGALCALALILITLGGAGLLSAQVFLGPKRDFVALATAAAGQRSVSIDMTTTPPRFEIGRDTVNGLRFTGGATGTYPIITAAITGADAAATVTLNPGTSGTVVLGGLHTTGVAFFPANTYCASDAPTTLIPTQVAANDWALARTATGAETINLTCSLDLNLTRTTASKGIRVDGLSLAYQVTVAALTTHAAPTLRRTTYANNTANSIDATGLTLTGTLATATQTLPYLTALTISSASFQVTANTSLNLDWQAVLASTGVYRLYGVAATYTHALY